jgi:hypothetical protein
MFLLLIAIAAAPHFKVQPLSVDGDVASVTAADFDGDGKKDLLAVYTTGLPPYQKRYFAIFWNRDGIFAPRPDLTMPVSDEEACAFDVGRTGAGKAEDLLVLSPKNVLAQSFPGRVPQAKRVLIDHPTLYHQPIEGELPRVRIVQDLVAPGSGDLLIPALGSLVIYKHSGANYEKTGEIEIDMEVSGGSRRASAKSELGPLRVSYGFPSIHIADASGDGLKDIIATQEDRIAVYRQQANATFHPQPDFTRDFAVRTASDHRERDSSATVMVADLDGDGVADLVVRKQVVQGISSATATSYVYFGHKGGGYDQKPAQELTSEGIGLVQPQLLDLTGDKRPDLIVPETSFGVFALIRMLTAKTAKVNYQVFPFLAETRKFAEEPISERALVFKIPVAGNSDLQAVSLEADVTGDGRPDLVFGSSETTLSIYPGIGKGEFAADSAEDIEVLATAQLDATDLNGKGRSDLLLHYPQTSGHRGDIVVLVNAGAW